VGFLRLVLLLESLVLGFVDVVDSGSLDLHGLHVCGAHRVDKLLRVGVVRMLEQHV